MDAFLFGLASAAGLIVAIGAQNAFVLRQGLARQHVGAVVALCAGADVLLIALGLAGAGVLVRAYPDGVALARWVGAIWLFAYALRAAARAWRPQGLQAGAGTSRSLGRTLAAAAAFTFLNPHVYLDTVLLLGTLGAPLPAPQRLAFGAGAACASVAWFALLGFGARALAPAFARPGTWRALDALIALVMFAVAVALLAG